MALPDPPRRFSDVKLGERFMRHQKVELRHLEEGAELIGDFNPLHVDEAFAQRSRFKGRILLIELAAIAIAAVATGIARDALDHFVAEASRSVPQASTRVPMQR